MKVERSEENDERAKLDDLEMGRIRKKGKSSSGEINKREQK